MWSMQRCGGQKISCVLNNARDGDDGAWKKMFPTN